MGFRYHRTVKILPGVKVNFNNNSHSVTIGGKYVRTTINKQKGTCRKTYRLPITGLSYTKTYKLNDDTPKKPVKPASPRTYKICGVLALLIGVLAVLFGLLTISVGGVVFLIIGLISLFYGVIFIVKSKQTIPETNSNVQTDDMSPETAHTQAEGCLKILDDCCEILQSTADPDVFFSRLKLMEKQIQMMRQLSSTITFSPSPDEIEKAYREDKDTIVHDFLVRCFNDTASQADRLKTDRGKKNCYQKLFDVLSEHPEHLSEDNLQYIHCKKQNIETILDTSFN